MTTHSMVIPDHTGHTSVKWDPDKPTEVETARVQFDAMRARNYQAFAVEGENRQGRRLDTFDPQVARIMFVPQLRGG